MPVLFGLSLLYCYFLLPMLFLCLDPIGINLAMLIVTSRAGHARVVWGDAWQR